MDYREFSVNTWTELENQIQPAGSRVNSIRLTGLVSTPPDFHLLVGSDSRSYAIIGIQSTNSGETLKTVRKQGLEVISLQKFEFALDKATTAISIACSREEFPSAFSILVKEICHLILDQGDDPIIATNSSIEKWSFFWTNINQHPQLTIEQQTGLFGELYILREGVAANPEFLTSWTAPDGTEQDFSWDQIKIEVKTAQSPDPIHRINGIHQLELIGCKALYLVSILIRKVSPSDEHMTIPSLIDDIFGLIDKSDRHIFLRKLEKAGYSPVYDSIYAERLYRVSKCVAYPVDGSFPRLIPASFSVPLSDRISRIEYSINCAGLENKDLRDLFLDIALLKSA